MINYKKLFSIVSKSIVVFSIVFCSCKINVTPKPVENPLPSNYIYVKDFATYVENSEETEVSVHILDKDPDLSIIKKGLDANKNKMLSIDLSECTDLIIIKNKDFIYCNNIKSIILPESITSIGSYAFYGCSGITEIKLSENIISIGDVAFYGCSGITELKLPESITSIGECAFYNSSIKSFYIPKNLKSFSPGAFSSNYLEEIIVSPENPYYDSRENCNAIINTEKNAIVYGCASTVIPNSVTSIARDAFYRSNIQSLIIPDFVTSIGAQAFVESKLKSIIIPSSCSRIEMYTFICCGSLESIIFPDIPMYFGKTIFQFCPFKTLKLPDAYCDMAECPFELAGIEELIIPPHFSTNDLLPSIFNFAKIQNIKVLDGHPEYDSRDNCNAVIETKSNRLILGSKNTVIPDSVISITGFRGNSLVEKIDIPFGVKSIEDYAFFDCENLNNVTISDSVTEIGSRAFYDCSKLDSLIIPDTVTNIGEGAFYNVPLVIYNGSATGSPWGAIEHRKE